MYTGPSCGVDVAKLGKGFRVQNIVSLMRVCYKWLEDAHKARLHVVSISVRKPDLRPQASVHCQVADLGVHSCETIWRNNFSLLLYHIWMCYTS